jgi:Leucine-rich repeat (LRR) protein
VIVLLYFSGGGGTGKQPVSDSWLSKVHECHWRGITCNETTRDIIALHWSKHPSIQFSSSIPSEMGLLTALQNLTLTDQDMKGTFPDSFVNLQQLRHLDLSGNRLQFDSLLGQLTNLQVLNLSGNKWTGTIPSNLRLLSDLRVLQIAQNDQLQGNVLEMMMHWRQLQELDASFTNLTGSIPTEIGALTQLQKLQLSFSSFTGTIPTTIGLCSELTVLSVSDPNNAPRLTGSIPSQLGGLTDLQFLVLTSNSLTSTIPTALGRLTSLIMVSLSLNWNITGTIPTEIGQWKSAQTVRLSQTSLEGSIPTEIAQMTDLTELTLYDTNLNGPIPSEICDTKTALGVVISVNCDIQNTTEQSDLDLGCPCCSSVCPGLD